MCEVPLADVSAFIFGAPPAFEAATDWQNNYFHLVFIDHPPHCIGAMFWEKGASYIINYVFCFNAIAYYFCDL